MDKECVVCGGLSDRVTVHRASGQSAYVCSTAHARKWKRSVPARLRDQAGDADASVPGEGVPPAPASAEGRRRFQGEQLTFLGGKPVERR